MISIVLIILVTLSSLAIYAWALAKTARAVGSRGRFRAGLAAAVLMLLLSVAMLLISRAMKQNEIPALATDVGLLVVQVVLDFLILRSCFKLGTKLTFVPFGVFILLSIAQLGFALLMKRYVAEAFVIPTGSMSPTLESHDRIVVEKHIVPRRFDIVAYRTQDVRPEIYCKRLVGLPGERIRFEQGGLFVNDQPVTLPAGLAGKYHASPGRIRMRYSEGETIALGPDEFFFVGDNADFSADSRMSGPSPASAIVGVADLIYWPVGRIRVFR